MGNPRVTIADLAKSSKRSKFAVRHDPAGRAARTYNGRLYDSALEGRVRAWLDLERACTGAPILEQQRFSLKGRSGTISNYVVDFVIGNRAVEAKGFLKPSDRAKMNKFRAQYPEFKLILARDAGGGNVSFEEWK